MVSTNAGAPPSPSTIGAKQLVDVDPETKLWSELPVNAWKNSVLSKDSVFHDLYLDTRKRIVDACKTHPFDVLVEVGCGTGEILAHLGDAGIPRIGVDINETFIRHCQQEYKNQDGLEFFVEDATQLKSWWDKSGFGRKYKSPLMICPNNTIMIMPECIRDQVLEQMRVVAGSEGRCVVTFWNKRMFAHGVMGFYKKNSDLCGDFDLTDKHVDWDEGTIETKTQYKSEWLYAEDVVRWMNSLLINVDLVPAESPETHENDHVGEAGMGVYLWIGGKKSSETDAVGTAREYYDSKDAQTFYATVWGESNTHIGRYDLIDQDPALAKLPLKDQIRHAQLLQEEELLNYIKPFYEGSPMRVLDMGCGFGGLLRTMARRKMLWSGLGVDISGQMIESCRRLTDTESSDSTKNVLTYLRESFMNTSAQDEGIDLVVSMEAFLHVGPGQHDAILKEAWRVLRPGGRLIFTDIVARPDAPPAEAAILYKRLGLTAFATVPGYFEKAQRYGFGECQFEEHSENVGRHYGSVLQVLEDLWAKKEIDISPEFKENMCDGLRKWRDLAPSCLQWGIISMRKLEQMSDDDSMSSRSSRRSSRSSHSH